MHSRALKRKDKKPSRKDRTTSALWISETTWKLSGQRTALGKKSIDNQGELRVLTRRFQDALKEYRGSRVRRLGGGIDTLVSNNQVR